MWFLLFITLYLQSGGIAAKECNPPFHPIGTQCLYFGDLILEDYGNAKAVCQSLEGNLARITEPQQLKDIVDHIHENDYDDVGFWLDGTDSATEGEWIYSDGEAVPMGTPYWYTHHSSDHWYIQPDNTHGGENCLEMRSEYHQYFNDLACNLSRSILCEENVKMEDIIMDVKYEDISCPPLFVPVSGLCLAFLTFAEQTWSEARQTCVSLGGQLAEITQPQHLRDIYLYIYQQGLNEDSFWIGGSDQETEGVWRFTDGSDVPEGSPFWGTNKYPAQEPDGGTSENCLVLFAPGYHYFRDANCDIQFNPICSIYPL